MRRRDALLILLPPLSLLPGCATRRGMPLDTALFPHTTTAPEARLPGRVAVLAPPAVRNLVHEGEDGPARALQMPVGAIVVQAMLGSADAACSGDAQRLDAPAPAPRAAGAGHVATLVIQAVRVSYHSHVLRFIPLPVLGGLADQEFDARLAVEVTLLDALGGVVWTRSYDDGRQVWAHEWTGQGKVNERLLRLTHEAAWPLAQRALSDLREWVEADRMRPRSL